MPRKSNIYKKKKGLAEDQIGLVIKPQQSICCIKTEGELGYHKL